MRLIDAVDDSYIIRRASYGMLQDEVSKYSLNLTKINLVNANKPKIYNIKSNIDPSLVGLSNSMGRITLPNSKSKAKTGRVNNNNNNTGNANNVTIQTVKVPFPVLIDRSNIVGKSDNALFNNTTFFGNGKITIVLYPFDNIVTFYLANGDVNKPDYLNLSTYGDIKLVFKTDSKYFEFPLYTESGSIDLSIGQVAFKISQNKYPDLKKIYESGVNLFYITAYVQNITSVVYTGLYKIHDNMANVAGLNQAANANPTINRDPNLPTETAIVTRRPVATESVPVSKPGMRGDIASMVSTVRPGQVFNNTSPNIFRAG
jgi:hypothetical protein